MASCHVSVGRIGIKWSILQSVHSSTFLRLTKVNVACSQRWVMKRTLPSLNSNLHRTIWLSSAPTVPTSVAWANSRYPLLYQISLLKSYPQSFFLTQPWIHLTESTMLKFYKTQQDIPPRSAANGAFWCWRIQSSGVRPSISLVDLTYGQRNS